MIQQFFHIKLSYLLMEIKLVLIHWKVNILQSLMSLIQSKIHRSVTKFQHMLRKICQSFLSMDKILSQRKALLMKSISFKLHVENSSSISVFAEGRTSIGNILKTFLPDFIKFDLWFHIFRFVSHRNLYPQKTLVKIQRVFRDNYGKNLYLCNMTRTKLSAFFRIPYQ